MDCESTASAAGGVFSQITKFEFNKVEREQGIQAIFAELSLLIIHQPIQFTVAGLYVITKKFMASVRLIDESLS